ncbi:hypothetical protein JQ554_24180 [Bradyrhizobium diazoefficiens]|nr:hypothetical protein [Bradyrhizobium diazoefficiens]MBR0967221.1 hypothetical protein [Bradyrhizobium diazoefficiens]MBR0977363.1 hypothetical protein [Bradyrhizobium diazoefficiens]MBR1007922.1 hypothetical protein [Bradyrhizobium diazoefficiens]MBR1013428.1 hypothetical protein [Bradyrhizobium diazoefficiens]MBR1051685.1 hypothetical protein [Bradyrhizobium diazoefficiens]
MTANTRSIVPLPMTTSSWDETTKAERRTWTVILLYAVMMVADNVGGTLFRIVGPDRG